MSNLGPCARRLVQLRHSLFKSRDKGADIQDPDRQPLEASDAAPLANMENDLSEYAANWRAPHPFDAEDQDAARSPWPLLFLARAWGLALSRPAYETRARRGRASSSFVGAFPNYRSAYDAWKSAAQRTVDNARMRYFIIHAHRLLDPNDDPERGH